MRFNKLDLNLLVALDALLAERSISRAAERLHMSQSAMSNALARLRACLDDDLLVQVGRKMECTPRAETLKEAVRDVLVRVDSAILAQPEFDPARSDRTFHLIVSDYTMVVLMPHLLALARQQARNVRFEMLPVIDSPQRELERGEADLLVLPRNYCSPDHPVDMLFEEEFLCVVWSGSSFGRANKLTLEQYVTAGHVAMQPQGMDKSTLEDWFLQRYGTAQRIEVTAFGFVPVPHLVVGTDRVATVHARLARIAQQYLPLALLPPPLPLARIEQSVQWHKYRTQDPGLVWLRGLLREAVLRMDGKQIPSTASAPATHP
ncbi:LysR family transcriptional regulator [Variovorax fucosicus]|uniref:LysR family transcriptional regulator n=1 Tax=Variovorax fucosicus TaxID=3053517 RepID=UPI002576F749|nr:LysR family transcriptional regulator [Variovorax sp. J22G47]MDM0058449.1 LysR family transcriptional regulator [Variovorax sp. J22G47]